MALAKLRRWTVNETFDTSLILALITANSSPARDPALRTTTPRRPRARGPPTPFAGFPIPRPPVTNVKSTTRHQSAALPQGLSPAFRNNPVPAAWDGDITAGTGSPNTHFPQSPNPTPPKNTQVKISSPQAHNNKSGRHNFLHLNSKGGSLPAAACESNCRTPCSDKGRLAHTPRALTGWTPQHTHAQPFSFLTPPLSMQWGESWG